MSYSLVSGETRNREHPETFQIPADIDRHNVQSGAYVKLLFVTEELGLSGPGERMWVKVTEKRQYGYTGILDNDPVVIEDLHCGDTVEFLAEHIIGIIQPAEV